MCPEWDWARQTPGGAGAWKDSSFAIDCDAGEADWWIVYDDLPLQETVACPSGRTVLITPEPPALKRYSPDFAAQFDWVITSDRALAHPRKIYAQQGLPWHVGRRQQGGRNRGFAWSYDALKVGAPSEKSKLLSVIASDKAHTPGHRARRDFVCALQNHFGSRIEVFGWGGREIEDKWDGIAPFRYHIAIENSATPDYWTEKLADAFLGGAFPIYFGCPNIFDYFPPGSLAAIEIAEPSKGIAQVESVLRADPLNPGIISEARQRILDRYNLFAMLDDFCASREGSERTTPRNEAPKMIEKTIRPAGAFVKGPGLLARARRRISRLAQGK